MTQETNINKQNVNTEKQPKEKKNIDEFSFKWHLKVLAIIYIILAFFYLLLRIFLK